MSDVSSVYDSVAALYDEGRASPFWRLWGHLTARAAKSCMPDPPALVLDAGAGTGAFSVYLLECGYSVVLFDPSQGMLEKAREKIAKRRMTGRAGYVGGRLEDMSCFPDESFDFVFSDGDPLSYCVGLQETAAREILRVLRPGGGFYVSCDNRWTATFLLAANGRIDEAKRCAETGASRDPYGNPVHAFTPEELDILFKEAGATAVRVTGKIGLSHLFPPSILEQILGPGSPHRKDFLNYEEALAESPTAAALASHLQVTGRRPLPDE